MFWRDLELIRTTNPLVLNVTNYVVANTTANALLALGASPIMSFAKEEVTELVGLSDALVVNVGTLNTSDIDVMSGAWRAANKQGIPVILDPVGAGASRLRIDTPLSMLSRYRPTCIRGNASEVMTLAGEAGEAKGVDSTRSTDSAVIGAKALAQVYNCVVCASGEDDVVTDGSTVYRVKGGHGMMPRITGLGCTATALCAAFSGVNKEPLLAIVHGMVAMAIAGKIAGDKADGPGTLQLHLYDALYSMQKDDVERLFAVEKL
ncbi:hydroxyethylthiazole kinase [Pseudodesulfovibrio sp.]|nr:hydroxyethylthiazole kinase [Pseudodesulfovibrio sp.]